MQLTASFTPLADIQADWVMAGVREADQFDGVVASLDEHLGRTLGRLFQKGDISGKVGELTTLLDPKGIAAERVLIVGLGKSDRLDRAGLTDAAATAARAVTGKQVHRLAFALPQDVPGLGWRETVQAIGVGLIQGCYGPGLRKSQPTRFAPNQLVLAAPPWAPPDDVHAGTHRAEIEGRAVQMARDLVNTPPCDLYPETFAQRAQEAASACGVECEIFDERRLEAEHMGALLGVARGSDRPPRLVVLRYRQGGDGPTLGLVGKGVTFDSGGLSLKTNEQMADMKCDMAGAAAVLAAMTAVAELKIPVNLLGVMALVENLPSGRAVKLGDVLCTRSGKTIEVLNTDAEGRLILADALAYAVDQRIHHLVDLATLTGACMVALGTEVAGLMSNNEAWSERVRGSAQRAGEKVWPLPMFPHFDELIKSQVADMKNTGGTRYGGAITAAKLLEQFVGQVPWAHLDIAGPAWAEHESPTRDVGGTGCFVRTLVELAHAYANS
jgi:leucyl aminopeptidase